MKIIELSEVQFRNYSKLHSARNYYQSVEYANLKSEYKHYYLGFFNEIDNTLMAATLLLEKKIGWLKIGYVPGNFLVDYDNDTLFKDFINTLKAYLKMKKYVYLTSDNLITYKIFNKNGEVLYFDTNLVKILDELSFVRLRKKSNLKVVLETEKTPDETFKLFNRNTKRNIKLLLERAITIFKDDSNNPDLLLNLTNDFNADKIKTFINNFNGDNKAEIYFAKLDPEKYINNTRFLLRKEEENNDKLNTIMQNINIIKTDEFINLKMNSDKLITRYNNEIIRATNIYTNYPNGVIIGAILIIKNNREIYFLNEGRNKEFDDLYSSHLLKWEIIKKYLNEDYKIFNFGSIKEMDKNDPNYNFKMGFGGKVYETIGTYDLIINKWLYYIVKFINIIIDFFKNPKEKKEKKKTKKSKKK